MAIAVDPHGRTLEGAMEADRSGRGAELTRLGWAVHAVIWSRILWVGLVYLLFFCGYHAAISGMAVTRWMVLGCAAGLVYLGLGRLEARLRAHRELLRK